MKQKFAFSRGAEARFKPGFRTYFQDRDLGVKEATGGRFTAEVHRACAPCPTEGSGKHWHSVDFQFNYVLKGWIRVWIDGEGEFTFSHRGHLDPAARHPPRRARLLRRFRGAGDRLARGFRHARGLEFRA